MAGTPVDLSEAFLYCLVLAWSSQMCVDGLNTECHCVTTGQMCVD